MEYKEHYTMDDIKVYEGVEYILDTPISHTFQLRHLLYHYIVNPYNSINNEYYINQEELLPLELNDMVTTNYKELLLDYNSIENNTLCVLLRKCI